MGLITSAMHYLLNYVTFKKEHGLLCQTFRNMFWSSSVTKTLNYNGNKKLTLLSKIPIGYRSMKVKL